ncbi:MAG: hypothetical protein ABSF43_02175 [Rectinemataceae bacterium]|jgi:hypothetical protein
MGQLSHKWLGLMVMTVVLCLVTNQPALAQKTAWGPWEPTGYGGISVSFSSVMPLSPQKNSVTWKFVNQTGKSISWFKYEWDDANGHQRDEFDYPLKPGAILGGWNAASFGPLPIRNFRITEVHYKD